VDLEVLGFRQSAENSVVGIGKLAVVVVDKLPTFYFDYFFQ